MITGRYRNARVAVVYGGLSNERAVSLVTGAAIAKALTERRYDVTLINAGRDLPARLVAERIDVVYNALHGTYGEDGRLPGLLDWMGLPYTGEDLAASLLSFDKVLAKQQFRARGLPVAADVVWTPADAELRTVDDLPFPLPVAVKPVAEGSSVGVTLVREAAAFDEAIRRAQPGRVLIEEMIIGPELSVACLGEEVLGSVEIEPAREFYDYEAKYGNAGTRYHLPPRLSAEDIAKVESIALAAHLALGCVGATRTDIMLGRTGPVLIEVNTLPGMTPTSLVPKIAAARGMAFGDLMEAILDHARCSGPPGPGEVRDGR
ncbi:MAG: D-alanine--D-alanine ligase [Myxococcales bacterium]|nr:D-alanine--D-alanine ligase [Myxococcales bacterium]